MGPVRFTSVVAVAGGGALGTLGRYELGLRFAAKTPPAFPITTLIINVTGAFALGLLLTLILEIWPPTRYLRPFAAIGVLGGYTTFSTLTVDSVRLLQTQQAMRALWVMALSLTLGMVAVAAGMFAARIVARGARA